METKNIMEIMIVALVGAVILVGFVPVIGATQDNIGEPITYVNGEDAKYHLVKDTTLTFERTYSSQDGGFVTFNGVTYSQASIGAFGNLLMSDSVTITQNSAGNQCNVYAKDVNTGSIFSGSASFTLVASNGIITITQGANVYTCPYTWLYYYEPNGEYSLVRGDTSHYVNNINNLTASGFYATGDNDCYYYVKDGAVYTSGYTSTVDYTLNKVEGTTDVYTVIVTVNVDGESYHPYLVLVPLTIHGHTPTGALYDIYGLIPLIVAVGLLMFVITAILIRRV